MNTSETSDNTIRETRQRVTGQLRYVGDMSFSNVLHGAFVRLECARARIREIDTAAAYRPGVVRIFTAGDLHDDPCFGVISPDKPLLAGRETKYCGEPVAFVLAESEKIARKAAEEVRVEYEELSPVLSIGEALKEDAPLVLDPERRSDERWKHTNVMNQLDLEWGDIETAREESARVIRHEYTAPFIHHFALEPYVAAAFPEGEGVHVLAGIQHPFQLRRIIAQMIGLPQNQVSVNCVEQGGAFGGRGYPKVEPAAAYFAYHLQRPVRIALSAEEGFQEAQRESALITCENGFAENGRMLYQDIRIDFGVGAYTDVTPKVVNKSGMLGTGPYSIPNCRIRARGIYTHTPPATAFRGFGAPHTCFAIESQLNEAAGLLGIDPCEIRLVNLPDKGEMIIPRDKPVDGEWKQALKALREELSEIPLDDADGGKKIGRGVAIGIKNSVAATSSFARIKMNADGSVIAYVGTTELGQGSKNTMAKIVSRELRVPLAQVTVVSGNTKVVPFDMLTASSRSTVTMGRALSDAAEKLKSRVRQISAEHLRREAEEVEIADGGVRTGEGHHSYAEVLAWEYGPGIGELEFQGAFVGEKDPEHPIGGPTPFYEIVMTAAEAEVDGETGELQVRRLFTLSDVGKLINPLRAEGVDEGGVVMGLGASAMEHLVYGRNGRIENPSSLDYRIPTVYDVPGEMHTQFQENEDGPGPFGSKGLGEGGILGIAPALAEAIYQSAGVRMRSLPFTSEAIWKALQEKEGNDRQRKE